MLSTNRLGLLIGLLLAGSLAACAPSLSPLYRDYEVHAPSDSVHSRIAAAFEDAGWTVVPADAPNVVATEERKVNSWFIYKVMVSLEAVPVGDGYVRLFVHPYRAYFTGNRSKIPFLKRGVRHAVLDDLNPALEQHGLVAIGTSVSRDRQAAAR